MQVILFHIYETKQHVITLSCSTFQTWPNAERVNFNLEKHAKSYIFLVRLSAAEKIVNYHGRDAGFPARSAMSVRRARRIL